VIKSSRFFNAALVRLIHGVLDSRIQIDPIISSLRHTALVSADNLGINGTHGGDQVKTKPRSSE
jgi:hypothetical protein